MSWSGQIAGSRQESHLSVIFSWWYVVLGHCTHTDYWSHCSVNIMPLSPAVPNTPQVKISMNYKCNENRANGVLVFAGPGLEECIQCAPDYLQQEWRCVRNCAPGYYRGELAGFTQRMCRKWVLHTSHMTSVLLHSDTNCHQFLGYEYAF